MNSIKKVLLVSVVIACAMLVTQAAQAQNLPFAIDNVPNVVGVAGGMAPDYWGSDDYQAVGAPFFRWTLAGQERYLQMLVTELSFNVLNHPNIQFGPVLNYRFGRDDGVDDDVVKKMEEIDDTIEAGIFVNYVWKNKANPRHRFIAALSVLQDVGNGHDGHVIQAGLRYWYPVSKPIDILVGVGTTYGSSDYMKAFFGVNSTDAARTGLPLYNADSSFRDVNVPLGMVFHFSENWHLGAGVKYFSLVGDAKDSPIVKDRGSEDQFVYGVGLAYSW